MKCTKRESRAEKRESESSSNKEDGEVNLENDEDGSKDFDEDLCVGCREDLTHKKVLTGSNASIACCMNVVRVTSSSAKGVENLTIGKKRLKAINIFL